MKSKYFLRVVSLLALLVSMVPSSNAGALPFADPPPVDMFQLPWDLGIAWVAIDGLDNGIRRPLSSSHQHSVGGAIDFAPHNNMRKGEDTSRFWVTAAAAGTVVAKSFCHVKIDHGNGWTTEYQFLANIQVKIGDTVARNQRLAIIADGVRKPFCLGSSEPNVPHLHFMLRPALRNASLAGWEINYLPALSKTTFRKNDQTVGLFKPLLNTFDQIQIVMRGPITWDTIYSGNVDAFRYERWSLTLTELNKFTLTATPTTSGLVPLIVLKDANGNEITRSPGILTSTQPVGNYFVQIQPQSGSGSYNLLLQRDNLPSGPYVSTTVTPESVNVGQSATATVRLNNVPADGYNSTEFTCTYNPALAQVTNILVADLFGADPVVAINDPQNGSFIVAVAGSKGNKVTTSGTAFTFSLSGEQAGQTAVECKARVSKGDNVLTAIDFIPGSLTVLGNTSTPVVSPTTPVESPVPTATPASPTPGTSATTPVESPVPTATQTQSPVPSTSTVLPSTCDRAEFIGDITIPNGTVFAPGATFTKTWRLKNIGPCTWTTSYHLVFFSGEQMGAVSSAPLPTTVEPGEMVDISLNMIAPNAPGSFRGYWMFRNSTGSNFGIGPEAKEPWFVEITVSGPTLPPSLTPTYPPPSLTPTATAGEPGSSPTPIITPGGPTATASPGTVYDFAANACAATWFSGAGQLPCPGVEGDPRGFVLKLDHPHLETGAFDSRPGLLTFPENVQNGYIQGFYPPFHVEIGDRFRSLLNCEFGATNCYIAFRLDYQVGAEPIKTFWGPFLERYDGKYYSVDVDLSSLAGKDVKFILTVLSAGTATGDRALWVGPLIYRAGAVSTPTSDVTSTPTSAVSATPTVSATSTLPGEWLPFTNNTYGFRFLYPAAGQIVGGGTDNSTRINLPFVPGTNLSQKYMQMTVAENVNPCRSPLATSSIPQTSETVVINGISFLKETGEDGTAGHINTWIAYSTQKNNACVSLDFVLRAANPGVFSTPPPLYDKAAESAVFGQIMSTYAWLTSEPTATPTVTQSTPGQSPTPTATQTPAPGEERFIAGKVIASKPVIVNVYDVNNTLIVSTDTTTEGEFRVQVPLGTYTVIATASGFLRSQGTAIVTAENVTTTMPTISLLAGDIDGNDVIDQFDALTIGMSYNSATPPEADLNNDGVINVLDLELLAGNYRKSAPQAWE
jgi:murein DD-endopeptidase MepM/ murein hydrolase activator NlpD